MLHARRLSRQLSSRFVQSLSQLRHFRTVSEAMDYHQSVSSLDPDGSGITDMKWLAYLTSLSDLDIKGTVQSIPSQDVTTVLQLLMTQQFHQNGWMEIKTVLSDAIGADTSNTSNVLAGMIAHYSIKDAALDKRYKNKISEALESRQRQFESYHLKSNLDRMVLAYYWMRNDRPDLVRSCFKDLVLVDELECFLMLKGLMIFPLHPQFIKSVVQDIIRYDDIPKLAAKLALFQPAKQQVVTELLLHDKDPSADTISRFVQHVSSLSGSYEKVHDIIHQTKIPDADLKQTCLNLHQSGFDKLFYTTFLALSTSATFDIIPLISLKSSSATPHTHVVHAIISYLKLGISELVPLLIKKIREPGFMRNNVHKDEWVMRVLKVGGHSFKPEDYYALITPMSTAVRALLIRRCLDGGKNLDFLKQIVLKSYEDETVHEVLLDLLKNVGTLSASDYVDDCLIHTCPALSGIKILSLIRFLADHAILSSYQQNFWMVVAYDKKEDTQELVLDILKELYTEEESSVYFSSQDLKNLLLLVSSDMLKERLQYRLDKLLSLKADFENFVLQDKSTPRLILYRNKSLGLLKENNLLYQISQKFGIHSAIAALQSVTTIGKNSDELVEFLRQIELNEDYTRLIFLMNYYSFLLPSRMKAYGERCLLRAPKSRKNIKTYKNISEIQMYLYSYLNHMPLDDNIVTMVKQNLGDMEIAHVLMVQCVLYSDSSSAVRDVLVAPQYYKHISKNDKKLLTHTFLHKDGQADLVAKETALAFNQLENR